MTYTPDVEGKLYSTEFDGTEIPVGMTPVTSGGGSL